MNNLTRYEFFEEVINNNLSENDQIDIMAKFTDNFDPEKVKSLRKDMMSFNGILALNRLGKGMFAMTLLMDLLLVETGKKFKSQKDKTDQGKSIVKFKDWFKDPNDFKSTFEKLRHIFVLEENENIRYIGENSEVKAICYLIVILQKKGYLVKTSRINGTQSKLVKHLCKAFNIKFTTSAFSGHKLVIPEDPCYSDVYNFIPYKS